MTRVVEDQREGGAVPWQVGPRPRQAAPRTHGAVHLTAPPPVTPAGHVVMTSGCTTDPGALDTQVQETCSKVLQRQVQDQWRSRVPQGSCNNAPKRSMDGPRGDLNKAEPKQDRFVTHFVKQNQKAQNIKMPKTVSAVKKIQFSYTREMTNFQIYSYK